MFNIDSCRFGQVIIDDRTYVQDVIILPDRIVSGWWRENGHSLAPGDLGAVIETKPEVFIMGCGQNGALKVPSATAAFLKEHGIELIAENTEKASRLYNGMSKTKRVACGLHLTC